MPLEGKNAVIYGGGGNSGGIATVAEVDALDEAAVEAAFAASENARTITASAINITSGAIIT